MGTDLRALEARFAHDVDFTLLILESTGYVYVADIAPLDRRDEVWEEFRETYPGIEEVARWGTLDNPIASSVADQAAAVLRANPNIEVVFAPYDEFAKGVKIAVDEAGMADFIRIYSADISTADIAAMTEPSSPASCRAGSVLSVRRSIAPPDLRRVPAPQ